MIAAVSSLTLSNLLFLTTSSVECRNHRSTRFIHELLVGVKWRWKRECRFSQRKTLGCLCIA